MQVLIPFVAEYLPLFFMRKVLGERTFILQQEITRGRYPRGVCTAGVSMVSQPKNHPGS